VKEIPDAHPKWINLNLKKLYPFTKRKYDSIFTLNSKKGNLKKPNHSLNDIFKVKLPKIHKKETAKDLLYSNCYRDTNSEFGTPQDNPQPKALYHSRNKSLQHIQGPLVRDLAYKNSSFANHRGSAEEVKPIIIGRENKRRSWRYHNSQIDQEVSDNLISIGTASTAQPFSRCPRHEVEQTLEK